MKRKFILALIISFLGIGVNLSPVLAHGANIKYESNMTYKIEATFEDGAPMDNAQVTIYAPDNPADPWEKGLTDENGIFYLSPDLSKAGLWLVQVRKAGHGVSVNITIDEGQFVSGETSLSKAQIILMTVSVLWGFVGTALYFSRRKN
ncbi:MAG: carboxypeptidase regulatory-like domain-containing protein [Bacillota bacterium]|nr:carboxypeptidase regulatory-like domain-containing protein [Bacillota bacterium]